MATYGTTDWQGANFPNITNGDFVWGVHTNVNNFTVPAGVTLTVAPYGGTTGGTFEISCLNAKILGALDATGAGGGGGGGGYDAVNAFSAMGY